MTPEERARELVEAAGCRAAGMDGVESEEIYLDGWMGSEAVEDIADAIRAAVAEAESRAVLYQRVVEAVAHWSSDVGSMPCCYPRTLVNDALDDWKPSVALRVLLDEAAARAREEEREACAKVAQSATAHIWAASILDSSRGDMIAAAIRARGQA